MQKTLIIAGGLVLAGAVIAYALAGGERHDDSAGGTGASATGPATSASLEQRVLALEAEQRVLREELRALQGSASGAANAAVARYAADRDVTPTGTAVAAAGGLGETEEATREALVELLDSDDPEVRNRLRAVMQEERERMHEERHEERTARRKAEAMAALQKLAGETDLDQGEVAKIAGFIDTEAEQLRVVFQEARRDHSWDQARERVGEIRGETDQKVKGLLDDEQYQAYATMREEEGGGFMRRGRGRGRGR